MKYTLDITNFQSIKHQTLEFTGFTVISGKSDLGKSATRRATETVLFNDWQKSYQRTNTNETKVTLITDNLTITAHKSTTLNSFTINDTKIDKINKDKPPLPLPFRQDLNISTQLEPMFMVAYKDADNTKILNQLFGIDILETAQYLASLDLRRVKQDQTKTKEELPQKQQEVDELTKKTTKLKELVTEIESVQNKIAQISRFLLIESRLSELEATLTPIETKQSNIATTTERLQAIQDSLALFYTYYDKRVAFNKTKKQLDNIQDIPSTKPLEDYLQLTHYIALTDQVTALQAHKMQNISFECVEKLDLLTRYLYVENCIGQTDRLAQLDSDIKDIDDELSKLVCPTCKQPISS